MTIDRSCSSFLFVNAIHAEISFFLKKERKLLKYLLSLFSRDLVILLALMYSKAHGPITIVRVGSSVWFGLFILVANNSCHCKDEYGYNHNSKRNRANPNTSSSHIPALLPAFR